MKFPIVLAIYLLVSVGYVSADWGSWWGSVTEGAEQLLNKTKTQFNKFGDNVKDTANNWADKTKKSFQDVKNEAENLIDKTKSEINKFGEAVKESANDLADKTKKSFEEVKNEAVNLIDKTESEINKFGEAVKESANDLADKTKKSFEEVKNEAEHFLDKTKDKAQDWAGKAKEGLETAQQEIENAFNKATNETKQFTDNALNKGQDIYQKAQKVVNETREFAEDAVQKTNSFLQENYEKFLEQHKKNMEMAKEMAAKVSAKFNELKKEFDVNYEKARREMDEISEKLKDMAAQSGKEFDKITKQIQHVKKVVVEQYENYQARAEVIFAKVVEQIQASREKVYVTLIQQAERQFGKDNVNEQECRQVIADVFMATLQSAKNETVPCFKSLLEKGIGSFVNTTKFLASTSRIVYDRYIKKCEISENGVEPINCNRHEAEDLVENGNSLLDSVKNLGVTIFSTKFELFKCMVLNIGRSVANFTKGEIVTKKMCIKNDALMSENGASKFESMINEVMDTVITYKKYLNDMKKYLEVKLVEGIDKVANVDDKH